MLRKNDETAITDAAAEELREDYAERERKPTKQSVFKKWGGYADSLKNGIDTVNEVYTNWIKPVYDNRAQIKRRLNAVSTAVSIIFFILYVPFLLFGKLTKDLALGVDVALYVCVGVYVVTIIALLVVSLATGKSTSTAMAERRKKTRKIVLYIVRIASVAIGITALVISAASGNADQATAVVDTIAIIFAVASIIFSALPLVFGGMGGFCRWLISPARVKYKFSFVALEWFQSFTSEHPLNKQFKRTAKKYGEKVGECIDAYLLPALGGKKINSVDAAAVNRVLDGVTEDDRNLCEWTLKEIFGYSEECGYIDYNPCKEMELEGDISLEGKKKPAQTDDKKGSVISKLSGFFGRKE